MFENESLPAAMSEQVLELGKKTIDFSDADCLPADIRGLIANPATFTSSEVLNFTTSHSAIAKILHENPASDRMLRIVYPDVNGQPLTEGLDRFLSHSLAGQALRDRLDFCSNWLAENFVREDKSLIDLGGGSGSYAFEALQIKKPPSGFCWHVIDIDAESVIICRQRTSERGLAGIVEAQQGNFLSSKSVQGLNDYAVLIGILCAMDHQTAVDCLKRLKIHLKSGAEIFAATLLQQAFDEDPRIFRILCNVGGWQLRPKTLPEVEKIFQEGGWKILEVMSERRNRPGQYAIVHAKSNH